MEQTDTYINEKRVFRNSETNGVKTEKPGKNCENYPEGG